MDGRARGRARGRQQQQQQQPAEVDRPGDRRPGDQGQQREQHPSQPHGVDGRPGGGGRQPYGGEGRQQRDQSDGAVGHQPSVGRAAYRGGTREPSQKNTGAIPKVPVEQMGQMSLGERGGGRGGGRGGRGGSGRGARPVAQAPRKRADYRYQDLKTKPEHITVKQGKDGRGVDLVANYFQLEVTAQFLALYQYQVDFNPVVESKSMKCGLLYTHSDLLGTVRAFDGGILYLPKKLPEKVTEVFSLKRSDETKVRITITLTNELPPSSPQFLQIVNIIHRKTLGFIGMTEIGRHNFNFSLKVDIPQHKLSVIPGFSTSVLQYEKNILLGADITHKVLRTNTVLDIMYDMSNDKRSKMSFFDRAFKALVGSVVLTRYNNKTYRVDDIDWDMRPTDKFKLQNGDEISYIDYYKKNYELTVTDADQPLLVSKPKKKDLNRGMKTNLYFLPEFCILTGISDAIRTDFQVMKDLSTHTRVAPNGRCQKLKEFITLINTNEKVQEEMNGWGLRFSPNLLSIRGRVLPQEVLTTSAALNPQPLTYDPKECDWSKSLREKRLLTPVNLSNWLAISTQRDGAATQDLVKSLQQLSQPMGIRVNNPTTCQLHNDRNETFLTTLTQNLTADTQMVLVVLPNNKKDRYDAIKKFTCIEHPVPSQVVVAKTLLKTHMLMSVATKIAIQINCKLGGEIWKLKIPLKGTMYVGIDTYHDGLRKGQSVAGIISSLNITATRYYSRVSFQPKGSELVDGLHVAMTGALRKYHEVNGEFPNKIIVYRDGVGDGQLAAVFQHEVFQVKQVMRNLGCLEAKLCFMIVKKRINARFFARTPPNYTNPLPGTIVDTEVTKPEWYDFFLVSQSVRQGTVTPTHYNIIWDETGLQPDHMQKLSYKLTHLYYNWPGTIRVPAPCQYAHKLAFLVGQSLHKEPSLDLADKLFFL
ncbi:piwi-like protein 1 isoform X1 [Patella vulgata]|uniref:piwi-like protein 1 isoform X1 n=1 Tax=Patella vulgata TaxID=6465 RepID=UPI00217FFD39|nr:piwi-like protein 1 isoform X1 [Patella vulgata]